METKVSFPTPATATNTASNTIARIDRRLNVIYFAPWAAWNRRRKNV